MAGLSEENKHWTRVTNGFWYATNCRKKASGVEWFQMENDKFVYYEDFIKCHDENSDKVYFLEVDVGYPKELKKVHNNKPFLKWQFINILAVRQEKIYHTHTSPEGGARPWSNTRNGKQSNRNQKISSLGA